MKLHRLHSLGSIVCAALAMFAFDSPARATGANPVLRPGPVIEVPASAGKFDFLQVDPINHRLLGAHEKDGSLDIFDLDANHLLTRLKLGAVVEAITDPNTGNYIVSVNDAQKILILDSKSLRELASIPLEGELDAVLLVSKYRRIYSAHDNGNHIWAIDADSHRVVATMTIPGSPECMVYDSTADRVYLNIKTTDQVAIIDPKASAITGYWKIAPASGPRGIVLDAKRHRIYVAGGNGKLVAIDTTTGHLVASADMAQGVDQAAFDPHTDRIYCAGDGQMSVLQASDAGLELLGQAPIDTSARNVAIDTKTGSVWTTYTDGKSSYAKSWSQR